MVRSLRRKAWYTPLVKGIDQSSSERHLRRRRMHKQMAKMGKPCAACKKGNCTKHRKKTIEIPFYHTRAFYNHMYAQAMRLDLIYGVVAHV